MNKTSNYEFPNIEDLFGSEKETESNVVTYVPLNELFPYSRHTFRVLDDNKMAETVESIKNSGVLVPGIVRPREFGGYEIIAGHRRKRACQLAGLEVMPVFIRELTDDEADVIMVDSNINREDLLFSEKAWSYRVKYEALKHQGKRNEIETADLMGKETGDSGRQIKRYIRLTYLEKELLDYVDDGKIKFMTGERLSYLHEEEQKTLVRLIDDYNLYPTADMAKRMKELSANGELTANLIEMVLIDNNKKNNKIAVFSNTIKRYFPKEYSADDIEKVLVELLEKWKRGQ